MDNKILKQFIATVAEIKELKPVTDGSRPPDDGTHVIYQGEWIEIDRKTNPTLGFKFIKLKPVQRLCQLGCGDIVPDQIIERRHVQYPHPHWKTRCATCHKYLMPTGELALTSGSAQRAYHAWAISNGAVGETRTIEHQDHTETITNNSIIKKYR
jgi:hypothetical protein